MAVFGAHVSAQVTPAIRDELSAVLAADRNLSPQTSDSDVVRLALEVGMPRVHEMSPRDRVVAYAMLRRGLPVPTS